MVNKYTQPIPKNEDEPVTTFNMLGQRTISLPRITDDKRLRGYPGLAGTARKLAQLVPSNEMYIEPFAGTAKVYQEINKGKFLKFLLNDKSKFVHKWLQQNFMDDPNMTISCQDFEEVMGNFYDKSNISWLIDQPWHKSFYDKNYSCFNRESVKKYDEAVLYYCREMRGKFIICTDRANPRMLKSGFDNYIVVGDYKVAGGFTKTLITTNIRLNEREWLIRV